MVIINSLVTRQLDPKGCRMSYMRPSYAKLNDFDTEHTRFASKYSLYLYREQGVDDDTKVSSSSRLASNFPRQGSNHLISAGSRHSRPIHPRKCR
jgi:hypothetical protein